MDCSVITRRRHGNENVNMKRVHSAAATHMTQDSDLGILELVLDRKILSWSWISLIP